MELPFKPLSPADRQEVMDLFNHYVENSFAAYPEERMPPEFFDRLLDMCKGYLNAASLSFHKKHGFTECGRFRGIGKKKGQSFDVVYMQRAI
jgi:L-amino acid N-acyltransferase YncA